MLKPGAGRAWVLPAFLLAVLLQGCAALGYYSQAVGGHLDVLDRRQPIEALIQAPETPPRLRQQLKLVERIRRFAAHNLHLPVDSSYRTYADLDRPFVVWNIFATPEFSLEPLQHCFLIIGCVDYHSYYDKQAAVAKARRLRVQGMDVWIGGVAAYSTLGWFADPVLNTMLREGETRLAGVIFHELAHQVVYVPGDTEFSEGFANAVQELGLRRWFEDRNAPVVLEQYLAKKIRREDFIELVVRYRRRLEDLYAAEMPAEARRIAKAQVLQDLRTDYARLKRSRWGGVDDYDEWFAKPINNAKLIAVGTYNDLVPGFLDLYERSGRDLRAFYQAVTKLAELPPAQRRAVLQGRSR